MKDKRRRALELLWQSRDRLAVLRDHFATMDFSSPEDLAAAQGDPYAYETYRDFSFLVHQLDLSTEGIRQIREMNQQDALDALSRHVEGDVGDFIALHKHLFHAYDGIDIDDLWGTLKEDVPMMIAAIESALADLEASGKDES